MMVSVEGVEKAFTLHLQGGLVLPVLRHVGFSVRAGECVALTGPSGAGKSTLLRALHGNYRVDRGRIRVRHKGEMVDLVGAPPRMVLAVRRDSLGYVSQFLRVIPRVPALQIVADAAVARGVSTEAAREAAEALLLRLGIPRRLHNLPPATFSGGEQQRINLARGFVADYSILLLDEPTASLDPANTEIVVTMIQEAKARGTAMIGIFHDKAVRDAVATTCLTVSPLQDAA